MEGTSSNNGIHVRHVAKRYSAGAEPVQIFSDLSLEIRAGDFVALMGPSGSGKTTLLNLLGGLSNADSGAIAIGATEVSSLSESRRAAWRARHVGFVFQSFNLIPVLRAHENVALPLLATGAPARRRKQAVLAALELTGASHRANHFPRQLSGGQQQRVAMARAIVTDPSLILCDEPTGNLDSQSSGEILDLLAELNTSFGKTIVMVTHDPRAAAKANRTLHLEKGRLLEDMGAA